MAERDVKRLSKYEMQDIILKQDKEIEELKNLLDIKEKLLEDRTIRLLEAGSIAEAALKLNGIFEAADAAVKNYVESIEALSIRQEEICAKREEESVRKAEEIIADATQKRNQMTQQCKDLEEQTKKHCELLLERFEDQCTHLIKSTRTQCTSLEELMNS